MIEQATRNEKWLYRLYFRLMDICLVSAALATADYLLDVAFGGTPWPEDSPIYLVVGTIILIFNFPVPMLLITARFMRDEYAEQLWRRAATVLAYGLAVGPFAYWVFVWIVEWTYTGSNEPAVHVWLDQESSNWQVLLAIWMIFLLSFVGVFQFLRWRDSR